MIIRKTVILFVLVILSILFLFGIYYHRTSKSIYLCGWLTYFDFRQSLQSFKNNIERFSEVNPFIYAFSPDGSIINVPEFSIVEYKNIIKIARENEILVLPTIVNDIIDPKQNVKAILKDSVILHKLLCEDTSINKYVDTIFSMVNNDGVDGIEIDYENINYSDKKQFIKFIKILSNRLHNNKKLLNIVLPANIFYGKKPLFNEEELSSIGKYTDTIKIMCYNLHGPFSNPGPVSTPKWIRQVLKVVTKKIPKKKICISLALHGFDWSVDGVDSLTYRKAIELLEKNNSRLNRTDEGIPYFNYFHNRIKHIVWFEDDRSIIKKIKTITGHGVNKIAFWRLGGESENIYNFFKGN